LEIITKNKYKEMKKVIVEIGHTGDNYCASSDEVLGCVATAHTLESIKKEYAEALDFHLQGMEEDGDKLPFERGKYELVYKLTAEALLQAYKETVPFSALSKATGINQRLLSHYANGVRKPRPQQREKIIQGFHNIGKELCNVE
jgi:predicted RNase H-like HicB family nuclease